MRMTLESNYAIRIVELLADTGEKIDAKTIAEEGDIPLRFCLKILRKLAADDIIVSFKGSKGGYMLNGKPEDITLRRVIEAVEGPFIISKCQGQAFSCNKQHCRLHNIYAEISQSMRDKLESYNFGELVKTDCSGSRCSGSVHSEEDENK